jgi:Predicted membrane protein
VAGCRCGFAVWPTPCWLPHWNLWPDAWSTCIWAGTCGIMPHSRSIWWGRSASASAHCGFCWAFRSAACLWRCCKVCKSGWCLLKRKV